MRGDRDRGLTPPFRREFGTPPALSAAAVSRSMEGLSSTATFVIKLDIHSDFA
jgi:hypothetical protein